MEGRDEDAGATDGVRDAVREFHQLAQRQVRCPELPGLDPDPSLCCRGAVVNLDCRGVERRPVHTPVLCFEGSHKEKQDRREDRMGSHVWSPSF